MSQKWRKNNRIVMKIKHIWDGNKFYKFIERLQKNITRDR